MEIAFEHGTAAHCEDGVTANLLRFYGYDYSEPLIFGLSASLYFVHLPFIKLAGFPVTSFRPLPGVIFARVTRLLGFKIHKTIFFNKKNAVKKLDSLLEKGIPTGSVVGMYFLPYMPIEYRFHFNAHNICIIGKENDNYLLSDPLATEKVTISSRDLLRARFSKGTYPPLGKLYWIKSLPKKEPDMDQLVRKAILKNCYRMIHEPGPMPFVGVNGFKHLGNKIPKFPKIYGEKKAALHLAQLVRMMEEIGTGGAGFRFLYAAFLQEASGITGISELNDFSQRLTDIGDQWRIFASEAGRIYKNRSSEDVDYQTIGDRLKAIGKQEELFFTELEKVIKDNQKK
ncbi:MAG: BtrH N-terminal domain-containing protein [Tannerella sp.]|jgi:hypothetical protein|nr:BtrH N-terminal domain-containing protein [Tannerella sp.]